MENHETKQVEQKEIQKVQFRKEKDVYKLN